jgi:anti-sigma regulatory factor (Ser/Thr protein kinase)
LRNGSDTPRSTRPAPFRRFEEKRAETAGWVPVDLGGYEAVSQLLLKLPAGPESAARARQALERLRGHVQPSLLETLRLLVTELVTNSVRHSGRAKDNDIDLEVDVFSNAVRVEVCDAGPGFVPEDPPTPHTDRPGGWGLCLVDRLADRWGVDARDRTRVWFEVDRAGDRRHSVLTA